MKYKRLTTYNAFVFDGRHYYPRWWDNRVILPDFSINANTTANHHKKSLVCESIIIVNRKAFLAISYGWYSRYGWRHRWFYFRPGKAITWRQLTWDERVMVCSAYSAVSEISHRIEYHRPPARAWKSWSRLAWSH